MKRYERELFGNYVYDGGSWARPGVRRGRVVVSVQSLRTWILEAWWLTQASACPPELRRP